MSNTKHAPEPWKVVSEKNERIEYSVNDANGHHVATFDGRYGAKESENKANATIAAASLDMLEALKKANAWIEAQITTSNDISDYDREVFNLTESAIKKATT